MSISRESGQDRFRVLKETGTPTGRTPLGAKSSSKVSTAVLRMDQGDEEAARDHLAHASEAAAAGLSGRAEADLRRLVERDALCDDVRALAWDALSLSHEAHGRRADALQAAETGLALQIAPARHARHALLVMRFADMENGLTLVAEGLTRWPEDTDVMVTAAIAALDVEDREGSHHLLERALAQQPDHPLGLATRARQLILDDCPEDALVSARLAVTGEPATGRALVAVSLYEAQRLEDDPGVTGAVLANLPTDWWALTRFGLLLVNLDELDGALLALDRAVTMAPLRPGVVGNRGYLHALRGDLAAADADLQLATADSADPQLVWLRGEVARLRGDYPTAIRLLTEVASSDVPEAGTSLGAAMLSTGDLDSAAAAYGAVIEQDPANVAALCGLGQVLMERDDLEGAAPIFQRAQELEPFLPYPHALLAEVLRRSGREVEAIVEFDRALKLNPAYGYALASKGQTLISLQDEYNGLLLLRQAVLAEPETAWILDELVATIEGHHGDDADLRLRDLQRELREGGADTQLILVRRARLASRQGRLAEAERFFAKARRRAPDDPGLTGELAAVLAASGRRSDALDLLDAIPELDDDQRWLRIEVLWGLGRLAAARNELELLYAAGQTSASVAAALGELHRGEGDRERARELLEEAMQKDSQSAYAMASLGALERDLEHVDEARKLLRGVLEVDPRMAVALDLLVDIELEAGDVAAVRTLADQVEPEGDHELVLVCTRALSGLGDHSAALQLLTDHLVEHGDEAQVLQQRGWQELYLGQPSRAARSFRAAAELGENDADLLPIVNSLLRIHAIEEAVATTRRAHERGSSFWVSALAMVMWQVGEYDRAVDLAEVGARSHPRDSISALVAAYSCRMADRGPDAVTHGARALATTYPDVSWRASQAENLWVAGHHDEARELFEDILIRLDRLAYLEPDSLRRQAWALFRLDRHQEAGATMLRALSATDQRADVLAELLVVTLTSGDTSQARMLRFRHDRELSALPRPQQRGAYVFLAHQIRSTRQQVPAESAALAEEVLAHCRAKLDQLSTVLAETEAMTAWADGAMDNPADGEEGLPNREPVSGGDDLP